MTFFLQEITSDVRTGLGAGQGGEVSGSSGMQGKGGGGRLERGRAARRALRVSGSQTTAGSRRAGVGEGPGGGGSGAG